MAFRHVRCSWLVINFRIISQHESRQKRNLTRREHIFQRTPWNCGPRTRGESHNIGKVQQWGDANAQALRVVVLYLPNIIIATARMQERSSRSHLKWSWAGEETQLPRKSHAHDEMTLTRRRKKNTHHEAVLLKQQEQKWDYKTKKYILRIDALGWRKRKWRRMTQQAIKYAYVQNKTQDLPCGTQGTENSVHAKKKSCW